MRNIGMPLRAVSVPQRLLLCARWGEALLPHLTPDSRPHLLAATSVEALHQVADAGPVDRESPAGRAVHRRVLVQLKAIHRVQSRDSAGAHRAEFYQFARITLHYALTAASQATHPEAGRGNVTAFVSPAHRYSAAAHGYLAAKGSLRSERARVEALQARQVMRARPLPGKPRKTPHRWDNATTRGLADRVYATLDPFDAAVLADALDEADMPAELAAPYRDEPDALTRADWLLWHLGAPTRVRLAPELPPEPPAKPSVWERIVGAFGR